MSKKILIVDDEEDIRELIGFNLGKLGYEIFEAANGTAAFSSFQTVMPDLVVTDINMPGGDDGWTFLNKLSEVYAKLPPVVVMSGYPKNADKVTEVVTHFMQKPFSLTEFLDVLEGTLRAERTTET
jgi:CheY-like chemotaxis protein